MRLSFRLRFALMLLSLGSLVWVSIACDGKQGPAGPTGPPVTIVYIPVTATSTPTFPPGTLTVTWTPTATASATPTPTPFLETPDFFALWGQMGDYSASPSTGAGYFLNPFGVAVDSSGNIYVADTDNERIQKFTSTGVPVTMWGQGGDYSADPTNGAGYFYSPMGVAVDSSSNVYVVEAGNARVQKFTSDGVPVTMWGQNGDYSSSPSTGSGYFNNPYGLAVDSSGNVYVADTINHRIQKFTTNGTPITMWGQHGIYSAPASVGLGAGFFNYPDGVAVDGSGNVYVSDGLNHRIQKFNSSGAPVTIWGQFGYYNLDPAHGAGYLDHPSGISVDTAGNVYVVDQSNNRVQKFTSNGVPMGLWGSQGFLMGQFNPPTGVAVNASGFIYIVDKGNNRIQMFNP